MKDKKVNESDLKLMKNLSFIRASIKSAKKKKKKKIGR
jgi:hypothetical protein